MVIPIFWYLFATLGLGITFTESSKNDLIGYTDSDYAGLVGDQKSTGGYIFIFSGALLSHQSKLQSTVAWLSTKTEYTTTTEAKKENM